MSEIFAVVIPCYENGKGTDSRKRVARLFKREYLGIGDLVACQNAAGGETFATVAVPDFEAHEEDVVKVWGVKPQSIHYITARLMRMDFPVPDDVMDFTPPEVE